MALLVLAWVLPAAVVLGRCLGAMLPTLVLPGAAVESGALLRLAGGTVLLAERSVATVRTLALPLSRSTSPALPT